MFKALVERVAKYDKNNKVFLNLLPGFHHELSLFGFPTTLSLPFAVSSTTNPASARRVFEASPSFVSDLITC